MKSPTESDLVRACLALLKLRGIFAWRHNQIPAPAKHGFRKFYGIHGISDIIGLMPPRGRLLACECKRPGYMPTAAQTLFLENVRANGGVGLVVTCLKELEQGLEDAA